MHVTFFNVRVEMKLRNWEPQKPQKELCGPRNSIPLNTKVGKRYIYFILIQSIESHSITNLQHHYLKMNYNYNLSETKEAGEVH